MKLYSSVLEIRSHNTAGLERFGKWLLIRHCDIFLYKISRNLFIWEIDFALWSFSNEMIRFKYIEIILGLNKKPKTKNLK